MAANGCLVGWGTQSCNRTKQDTVVERAGIGTQAGRKRRNLIQVLDIRNGRERKAQV